MSKTQYVRGSTLKIYRVRITDNAGNVSYTLWDHYQSAAQSYAYWGRKHPGTCATLEAVHVPEDGWKTVDPLVEARLSQISTLWEQLVATDEASLDYVLDQLVRRVQPPKPVPVKELPDAARREATALLEMDRLVAR